VELYLRLALVLAVALEAAALGVALEAVTMLIAALVWN